jgi:hypothetical protein
MAGQSDEHAGERKWQLRAVTIYAQDSQFENPRHVTLHVLWLGYGRWQLRGIGTLTQTARGHT